MPRPAPRSLYSEIQELLRASRVSGDCSRLPTAILLSFQFRRALPSARTGALTYLFESLDSDFSREITVDQSGFVVDYPGLFTRG